MYNTINDFINSPEYLMLSSRERNLKEEELKKKFEEHKKETTTKIAGK